LPGIEDDGSVAGSDKKKAITKKQNELSPKDDNSSSGETGEIEKEKKKSVVPSPVKTGFFKRNK